MGNVGNITVTALTTVFFDSERLEAKETRVLVPNCRLSLVDDSGYMLAYELRVG